MLQLNFSKHVPCTIANYATLAEMRADTTLTSDKKGKQCYCYEDRKYYIVRTVTPAKAATPAVPAVPEVVGAPAVPATPTTPAIPAIIAKPAIPAKPATPATPAAPATWVLNNGNPNTNTANFTLNMAGQQGLFKADTRLGFWDSANAVVWGDIFDKYDLTPSKRTRGGISVFSDVAGRIVQILSQGTGFVIYSTKNIVGVRFTNDIATIWATSVINDMAGIAYPRCVVNGATENEQYAYTTLGLMAIGKYNPLTQKNESQPILPEFFDLLKESRNPIYLDYINGRYLFICTMDAMYLTASVQFNQVTVPAKSLTVLQNGGNGVNIYIPGITVGGRNGLDVALQPDTLVGVYLIWRGNAERMDTSRTTDLNPFTLDSWNTPIPNPAPLDTASRWTPADIKAIANGGTPREVTTAPVAVESAWVYPGPNKVDMSVYGIIDPSARNLINLQKAEWQTFNRTLANTIGAMSSASVTLPPVRFPTVYKTAYEANVALDAIARADIVAHNLPMPAVGTWVNKILWYEVAGTIKGQITSTNESITGVGTSNGAFTLIGDSPNGYEIKRTITRYYNVSTVPRLMFDCMIGGSPSQSTVPAEYQYPVYIPLSYLPFELDTAALFAAAQVKVSGWNASIAIDARTRIPLPITCRALVPGPINLAAGAYSGYIEIQYSLPSRIPGHPPYDVITEYGISASMVDTYETSYQDVVTLTATPVPWNSPSTFTLQQTSLEWGLSTNPPIPGDPATIVIPPIDIVIPNSLPPNAGWTYPGSRFLLQDGSIAPLYPTMQGAWVLDTGLKKWGKMAVPFKHLINFSAVNDAGTLVPYTNFSMDMAILNPLNNVVLMGTKPLDSWIRYGKIGMARLGFTHLHEVKVDMRTASNYTVAVESSLDGRALDPVRASSYASVTSSGRTVYVDQAGRWHTIKISGQYDLTYLEVRGSITSRR